MRERIEKVIDRFARTIKISCRKNKWTIVTPVKVLIMRRIELCKTIYISHHLNVPERIHRQSGDLKRNVEPNFRIPSGSQ